MIIIGANINSSEDMIDSIIEERDSSSLLAIARAQLAWGASILAVNCGTRIETEPSDLVWMTQTIQKELPVTLCFDSPNPEAHAAALAVHRHGRAMIDSITAEQERMDAIIPLAVSHHTTLTALLHDESGMPSTKEDRLRVLPAIIERTRRAGISSSDLYLDAMVFPLATGDSSAAVYLETLIEIRSTFPEYNTICGLNNISYGLPERDRINSGFLHMCAAAGQHAVYVKLSDALSAAVSSQQVLTGGDPFCTGYLQAYRRGSLDPSHWQSPENS